MRRLSRVAVAFVLSGVVVGGSLPVTPGPGQGAYAATHSGAQPDKPRPKDPDGTYDGGEVPPPDNVIDQVFITFKVKRDGRRIKLFVVTMNVVCSTYPVSVELISQPMNPMKVKRSGRFRDLVAGTTDDGTDYRVEVTGRLKGHKVKDGTLSYDVGLCQRGDDPGDPMLWTAKRTSR